MQSFVVFMVSPGNFRSVASRGAGPVMGVRAFHVADDAVPVRTANDAVVHLPTDRIQLHAVLEELKEPGGHGPATVDGGPDVMGLVLTVLEVSVIVRSAQLFGDKAEVPPVVPAPMCRVH